MLVTLPDTFEAGYLALDLPRTFIFGDRTLQAGEDWDPDPERLKAHEIRVEVVPEAGHGMMFDNPEGLAAVLSKALGSVADRA
jgi:pimeloyl-ACP methyl ester carboxylesterase